MGLQVAGKRVYSYKNHDGLLLCLAPKTIKFRIHTLKDLTFINGEMSQTFGQWIKEQDEIVAKKIKENKMEAGEADFDTTEKELKYMQQRKLKHLAEAIDYWVDPENEGKGQRDLVSNLKFAENEEDDEIDDEEDGDNDTSCKGQ